MAKIVPVQYYLQMQGDWTEPDMTRQISILTAVILCLVGLGALSASAQMSPNNEITAPASTLERLPVNPFMDNRIEDWSRKSQRRADQNEAPARRKSLFNE